MALENILSKMGLDSKQLTDRYAEYTEPMHDQHLFYAYDTSSPAQGHAVSTKHHYVSGGHKGNAAMSALTLLAFLFFLHILQQCLKDHMTTMNSPQVMIMTAGKEGEENIAKLSHEKKIDKAGILHTDKNPFRMETLTVKEKKIQPDESQLESTDIVSTKPLLKIKTAEHSSQNGAHKYKIMQNHNNRSYFFSNFYD